MLWTEPQVGSGFTTKRVGICECRKKKFQTNAKKTVKRLYRGNVVSTYSPEMRLVLIHIPGLHPQHFTTQFFNSTMV